MSFQNIRKIIFTGPESTGKTTGATAMSKQLGLPLVQEYARVYLAEHGLEYKMADLYNMLNRQYEEEDTAHESSEVIICDTDWLTIHIWAQEVFGKRIKPPFDLDERHYVLCTPDIPWEPDPLRENPLDRDRLFGKYKEAMLQYDLSFELIGRK